MKFCMLIKYENASFYWHFHIYYQTNFHAQLCLATKKLQLSVIWDLLQCSRTNFSWAWKKVLTSGPGSTFVRCFVLNGIIVNIILKGAQRTYSQRHKTYIWTAEFAVWSESSLSTCWIYNVAKFLHSEKEDSNQAVLMRSLIWVFVGRSCQKVRFCRTCVSMQVRYRRAVTRPFVRSSTIDLWAQLLLQFLANHFETSQVFGPWCLDMHIVCS